MRGFKLGKKFSDWLELPFSCVVQALTDAFLGVGLSGNVEQALIGFSVLHDGRRLTIYGEHDGALALLEVLNEVAGRTAEGRQRLNVRCNIQHLRLQDEHLIRCFQYTVS